MGNKNMITNIFRIQACKYFCIRFIDFMLKGKSVPDYTNLFSPNEYEKNDKTNSNVSLTKILRRKNHTVLFVVSISILKMKNIIHFPKNINSFYGF